MKIKLIVGLIFALLYSATAFSTGIDWSNPDNWYVMSPADPHTKCISHDDVLARIPIFASCSPIFDVVWSQVEAAKANEPVPCTFEIEGKSTPASICMPPVTHLHARNDPECFQDLYEGPPSGGWL